MQSQSDLFLPYTYEAGPTVYNPLSKTLHITEYYLISSMDPGQDPMIKQVHIPTAKLYSPKWDKHYVNLGHILQPNGSAVTLRNDSGFWAFKDLEL